MKCHAASWMLRPVRVIVTRRVTEDPTVSPPDMSELESRVVTFERQLQAQSSLTDSPFPRRDMKQEMAGQSSAKQIKRDKTRSARAVNSLESNVRDKLLRRIAELEATKAVGQQQLAKLSAKNNTLNKEVGRLKHVTELRSSSMAASSQSPNNQSNQ